MYAYIDRKKKLPVTTLLRSIGYERDRDILEIFDLAEEVKVSKAALKRSIGRKLAARVLKTWIEDFVDEDTGEVVSIERNEVILERETILKRNTSKQILILVQDHHTSQGGYQPGRLRHHLQYASEGQLQLGERSCGVHLPPASKC